MRKNRDCVNSMSQKKSFATGVAQKRKNPLSRV